MLAIPAAWADVDYKKYAGSKIETNLIKGPRGDLLQKYEKEFTALTGIEVNSEVIPEQQQRQKNPGSPHSHERAYWRARKKKLPARQIGKPGAFTARMRDAGPAA